jgi:hypothetical protein
VSHPSKTPAEAVERYRGRAVQLLSCVTSAHTTVSGYHVSDLPQRLSVAGGDPVRLRGESRLTLEITEQFRLREITDGWIVQIVGYL